MLNRLPDTVTEEAPSAEQPAQAEGPVAPAARRRPWYLYLLGAVVAALAVLSVAEIGPPSSSARTSTQIVTAQQGVVQSTVTGSGNVQAGTEVNANFQTSGTLSNLYVHVGQHVEKGQLLATLNETSAQLTLNQAEASLTAAQDQLSSAESGSSTSSGSTGSSSGSSTSGSSSTTSSAASIASAQAAVDSARASVNNAQSALNGTKLYAPISGTIASLASLSPGDNVSAGSNGNTSTSATSGGTSTSSGSSAGGSSGATTGSLGGTGSSTSSSSSAGASSAFAQIVNTGTMKMTVAFSESDVNKLKVGQAATVTPDALSGVELGAHVTAISPVGTASNSVVSYSATLTLDQHDSSVKPGMSASAAVIVGQAQGITVPNAAVSGTGSLATVTVMRNGKPTQQQVAVGLRGDSRSQILSGLSAGEQVVIKTTLPALGSTTTSTTGSNGTLGGSGTRPGGFGGGGAAGGSFGGGAGAAGGRTATPGGGG